MSNRNESTGHGGEALLALMAFAVLLGSGAIAALGVFGSWGLLPVAILAVVLPAIAVAAMLGHLMADQDEAPARLAASPAHPEPAARPHVATGH